MAQTNRNIDNMSPFITFCQHVIPLSYDESLSYYETLCALRNYIGEMVKAVNNNADAVTELQNKFTELQNYVDNYFKNLDVQEEINNKLDEMAQDGTLQNIIGAYLELASVLAYNTKSDLKNASNLNNGAFTYTYGTNELLDGYGVFYKIRKLVNTDQVDDENILSLTNYPELIAEKMPNKFLTDLQTNINENITPQIEEINQNLDNLTNKFNTKPILLVIGDSWSSTDSASVSARDGADTWVTKFTELNPDKEVINLSLGATGFCKKSGNTDFITEFTDWATDEENASKLEFVKEIIIYGGINDIDASYNATQIMGAMQTLDDSIKQHTPKAKVYFAYYNHVRRSFTNANYLLFSQVSQKGNSLGWNVFKAYTWLFGNGNDCFASDGYHPNTKGIQRLCGYIMNMLNGGQGDYLTVTAEQVHYIANNYDQAVDGTVTSNLIFNPFLGHLIGSVLFTTSGDWVTVTGVDNRPIYRSITNLGFMTDLDKPCPTNYASDVDGLYMRGGLGYNNGNVGLFFYGSSFKQETHITGLLFECDCLF